MCIVCIYACTDTHTDGPFHSSHSRHLKRQFWPLLPRLAPQFHIHSFIHRSFFFLRSLSPSPSFRPVFILFCLFCLSTCLFLTPSSSSIRVFSFLLRFFVVAFFFERSYTHTEYTSSLVLQENRNQQLTIIKKYMSE